MTSAPTRWFERVATAAMVLVGFAAGSVGLSMLADARAGDPVLTDEFRLEEGVDGVLTVVAVTSSTTTTTTTVPPAPQVTDTAEADDRSDDDDRRRGDRDDDRRREDRPPRP
ncbi:MAG: hypothetical protein AAGE98_06100 [Actinomycetota bacterium]